VTGPDRLARNILKIRPPLIFNDQNVDQFVGTLDKVLKKVGMSKAAA
jgi:4-aminobutyrate aminotransferase-like enzyme